MPLRAHVGADAQRQTARQKPVGQGADRDEAEMARAGTKTGPGLRGKMARAGTQSGPGLLLRGTGGIPLRRLRGAGGTFAAFIPHLSFSLSDFLKLNFRLSREGLSFCPYERCLDQVVDDAAGVALMVSNGTRGGWRVRSRAEVRPRAHILLVRPLAGHVFLHGLLTGGARPEPFCMRKRPRSLPLRGGLHQGSTNARNS